MSKSTRTSHKQLMKALTIQAIVPIFWLTASSLYLLLLFQLVDGAIFENVPFRIMECMPMLTPLISLYFVRPYRSVISGWILPDPFIKPVILSAMLSTLNGLPVVL
ncbi:Protein CBR-SRD-3 [Caenorhabditis briggsae]|nr:Protein CBR-SRD-3 [Caenorhabditis briggsae]ULU09056.1 hypothetical protein L3Y34_019921 [Caenorhabditis briggsae]CAP27361.2 Protein CBR-SRD-3 [Caenorhabditis briggsae]